MGGANVKPRTNSAVIKGRWLLTLLCGSSPPEEELISQSFSTSWSVTVNHHTAQQLSVYTHCTSHSSLHANISVDFECCFKLLCETAKNNFSQCFEYK